MSHGARLNVKMIVKLSLRLRVSEITKRVVKNFEMKRNCLHYILQMVCFCKLFT